MDDDFGDDADFAAALAAVEKTGSAQSSAAASGGPKRVQQPKPQALPNRSGPSAILVSPRQKGNPILNNVRSLPWEYSDIPADFVLGATTCCLFLSLKYHRLHPEYIYNRIRNLGHLYNLRVLLTMVDIQNHEEPLKELSKTSMVNNLTLILCWSAQEAGRYLELYKSYEHASPTSIKAHQSTSYRDKLVEFVTTPRSINTTDATSLISAFGSIRAAVNARPEEIGMIPGWGEKKVQRWCQTVHEPFRVRKAAKRGVGLQRGESSINLPRQDSLFEEEGAVVAASHRDEGDAGRLTVPQPVSIRERTQASATPDAERRPPKRLAEEVPIWEPGADEEEALLAAAVDEQPMVKTSNMTPKEGSAFNDGIAAALAKLRQG
ncbi:ssDNA endonuclease and repair protein rad10 [Xanthoria calcicola]